MRDKSSLPPYQSPCCSLSAVAASFFCLCWSAVKSCLQALLLLELQTPDLLTSHQPPLMKSLHLPEVSYTWLSACSQREELSCMMVVWSRPETSSLQANGILPAVILLDLLSSALHIFFFVSEDNDQRGFPGVYSMGVRTCIVSHLIIHSSIVSMVLVKAATFFIP